MNLEDSLHSLQHLKTEVRNFAFFVILVQLLLNILGCGGQPLHSKSILKASIQMVRLCDYATVFFSYLHIGFLTFLALLKTHSEMEHPVYVAKHGGNRRIARREPTQAPY